MPVPFYYKVKPGELWSSIANLFKVPQQSIIQANPGVSQLSTGMKIKVPSRGRLISPAAQTWIGAGALNPNQSSTGTPATPAKPVTPLGMYTQPKTPFSPYRTGADPYATIKYERDPVTGAPQYNYTDVYVNGEYQGQYPRSIYVRDVRDEAYRAGVTEQEYVESLTAMGYVLFGGAYVYVGDGSSPAAQAASPEPVRAFYRVGRGRDKWVATEQAAINAGRRRGEHYQERMEYRNEQERRKKEGKASEGSLNVNFGVGAG